MVYGIVPVIINSELNGASTATWAALCSFCKWERDSKGDPIVSKAGSCFPSLAAIAERANISVTAVRYSIRTLEMLESVEKGHYGSIEKGHKLDHRKGQFKIYP